MINRNPLTHSGRIITQIIGQILYFPVWWYTVGFVRLVRGAWRFFRNQEKSLAWSIWIKNLFVPMYGQNDWAGRLISFFVRSAQILGRSVVLFFWLALILLFIILWLAAPLLILLATAFQFVR
jgi:hypothetical protein